MKRNYSTERYNLEVTQRKLNDENSEETNAHQVIAMAEQITHIFKLNSDCFEKIFDHMPLRSIIAFGETCKCFQRIAGEYFQQHFSDLEIIGSEHSIKIENCYNNINRFTSFIKKIRISCDNFQWLQLNRFQSLTQIEFYENRISSVECMKEILCQIQIMKIGFCRVDGDFYEIILKFCKNVKRLCLRECESGDALIGSSNNWLHRNFSTLEHFEVRSCGNRSLEELKTFLELNPNIRKLAINSTCFKINKNTLLATDAKLNNLAIDYDPSPWTDNTFYTTLNELLHRNFYKRLHFYCRYPYGLYNGDRLDSLNAYVKLHIITAGFPIDLSIARDLEELCIPNISHIINLDMLCNLKKLERISMYHAKSDDILPFITSAKQLRKIKISQFHSGLHFNRKSNILDLIAFNEERKKLDNAIKVTIYAEENVYLATKRAMGLNELTLIDLKRIDSFDCDHDFSYFYK